MNKHVKFIISELINHADKNKSEWWNNYLRHEINFIGVGIPDIRKIIVSWKNENNLSISELFTSTDELMSQDTSEYKLAAILIYQQFILGNIKNSEILNHINIFFDNKYIFDWNTCDWLCVKILTAIINQGFQQDIKYILDWYKKDYLWYARAALVPFTQCKNLMDYIDLLILPMHRLIKRPERFAKTSVGWLLREISKKDQQFVEAFLLNNKNHLTTEIINNALKYSTKDMKKFLKLKLI